MYSIFVETHMGNKKFCMSVISSLCQFIYCITAHNKRTNNRKYVRLDCFVANRYLVLSR